MGQGEKAIASRVCAQIAALMLDLAGLPSVSSQAEAVASLELVKADFEAFVGRFVKSEASNG